LDRRILYVNCDDDDIRQEWKKAIEFVTNGTAVISNRSTLERMMTDNHESLNPKKNNGEDSVKQDDYGQEDYGQEDNYGQDDYGQEEDYGQEDDTYVEDSQKVGDKPSRPPKRPPPTLPFVSRKTPSVPLGKFVVEIPSGYRRRQRSNSNPIITVQISREEIDELLNNPVVTDYTPENQRYTCELESKTFDSSPLSPTRAVPVTSRSVQSATLSKSVPNFNRKE